MGSELSGTIQEVFVDYNDQVTEGQVLARLDIADLQAQVRKSKASLASARASVQQAQATVEETNRKLKNLKKVRELSGGKVPAQTDMDQAQANYTRAMADRAMCRSKCRRGSGIFGQHVNRIVQGRYYFPCKRGCPDPAH